MSVEGISETNLYLTFKLEDEVFALDVAQVLEVLDLSRITKVPRSADFMCGVINVRGSVVPVVDLRLKLGIPQGKRTKDSRIVMMEIDLDGEKTVLGAMADSVHEVLELDPGQIEESPKIGARWRTEFIKGIGKREDEFIIILDIDRVFSSDELAVVQKATEGETQPEEAAVEAVAA